MTITAVGALPDAAFVRSDASALNASVGLLRPACEAFDRDDRLFWGLFGVLFVVVSLSQALARRRGSR